MEYAARARRKEKGILTHNNYLGCENINLTYGTCSAWINWTKVLVVTFRKESMQKSVPIDAADMRTVKKTQIFPHYRVDPHNFCKGMELERETSVLAKKTY